MMIVHEINDPGLIKKVLCHPDIYWRISDDFSPTREEFKPPFHPSIQYVAGFVGGDIIGLMIYHNNGDAVKVHFQVLPEYRGKSIQFMRMALNFGKAKNATLIAEIPECFPEVIKFAKYFNFEKTGNQPQGRILNGVLHHVAEMRLHNGCCR